MNSDANRPFDRRNSKSITFRNNSRLATRSATSFRRRVFCLVVTLVSLIQLIVGAATEDGNSGRLVDIGGGRKIYLECRGTGSPTVVLISGTRGAYDDWTDLIDAQDPAGAPKRRDSAVLPHVSKITHVCAYDRPGTTRNDNIVTDSTLVPQPTTAQQGVADLSALLKAANEPGPYVLVGHSWGGLIARLFASTYPDKVVGLVLIDPASEFLKTSLTPEQWSTYIKATRKLIESKRLEAPDHAGTLGLLHGSPQVPAMPVVVLTSDKRFDFGAGGTETWPAWRIAQDRLATRMSYRPTRRSRRARESSSTACAHSDRARAKRTAQGIEPRAAGSRQLEKRIGGRHNLALTLVRRGRRDVAKEERFLRPRTPQMSERLIATNRLAARNCRAQQRVRGIERQSRLH